MQLRNVMTEIHRLDLSVNGQGQGLAYLVGIGFSGDPDPANPGGVSDAELAQTMISYENTVAQVYFGAAAQTPAFNFDQELSQVWGGHVE